MSIPPRAIRGPIRAALDHPLRADRRRSLWRSRLALAFWAHRAGPSKSDYDIAVDNDVGDALPLTLPPLRIAGNAQYDPLAIAAEVAWRPTAGLDLAAQLDYQRWSAYPPPTQSPLASAEPRPSPDFTTP